MRGGAPPAVLAGALFIMAAVAYAEPPDLPLGQQVYQAHCAICHGERGDGQGHAAHHFSTPPRDLTSGRYKFRSTGSGQLPTDADLRRTIVMGVPGTGMVPQNQLSDAQVRAVIDFLKSLSPRFASSPPPKPLAIPAPPPRTPEAIARGRKVYDKGECQECHGKEARGDGPSAKDLKIKPSDLTRRPLKGGPTPRDIVRSILTGLDGTPMPSYHLILDDDELWDLAYYMDSLGGPPVLTEDERAGWHVVRMHQRR